MRNKLNNLNSVCGLQEEQTVTFELWCCYRSHCLSAVRAVLQVSARLQLKANPSAVFPVLPVLLERLATQTVCRKFPVIFTM